MKNLLLLGMFLILSFPLLAQESRDSSEQVTIPKRSYITKKITSTAPVIDGKLDDAAWETVGWGENFRQLEPTDGGEAVAPTAFKILYDDAYLYAAFRCYDPEPDKIVKRMSRRDGFEGDWIELNLDSYNDQRTAFSFTGSVSGVKGDEYITNNGNNWDDSWNPIWNLKTNIDAEGWTAEFRIPLSQLRYGNKEEHIWGIQVQRRNFRHGSRSIFQYIPRTSGVWVSGFAELQGIQGIKPQKQIEIQPYVVAQTSSFEKEEGNPFRDGTDNNLAIGLDGKIGVTSDFVVDFTINPDFGQVEADPSVVRLDGFQNFFSERRPFFVENNNIFDFTATDAATGGDFDNDNLFYSRRIGTSPHGYPDLEDGEFANVPSNTSILGAAKFSGKNKQGLTIGILESVTAKEVAAIDLSGERREEIVEPLTNYFIGRVQQDLNKGNTVFGGMFTAVNRKLTDTPLDYLHENAYTGGIDFLQYWNNQDWSVSGKLLFSRVEGSTEAINNTQTGFEHYFQRPDADHLEVDESATSLTGTGGTLKVSKFGGNWKFQNGVTWRSPGLELNDIGFMNNADEIHHFFWTGYRFTEPFSIFRNLGLNLNFQQNWDFGGNHLHASGNVNFFTELKNFYFVNAGIFKEFKDISNQSLFGGPALRRSTGTGIFFFVSTDQRKKIQFSVNGFIGSGNDPDQEETVKGKNIGASLTVQPTNAFNFSLRPSINTNDRLMQYVSTTNYENEARYIVSSLDQNTFSMTIRLNYNITPNLTLQYYGQPFITRVRYFDFKRITNSRAINFHDRYLPLDQELQFDQTSEEYFVDENMDGVTDYSFGVPDFSFIQFRSNLVARWEYVPGSELFLVWNQGTTSSGDPSDELIPSLRENVFENKATNIFLIKWTYRFLL